MIAPSPASLPGPLCSPQTQLGDSERRCSQPPSPGRASPPARRPVPPPARKMRRASRPSEARASARHSVGLKTAGRVACQGARTLPARASGRSFSGAPGRALAAVEGDRPLSPPLQGSVGPLCSVHTTGDARLCACVCRAGAAAKCDGRSTQERRSPSRRRSAAHAHYGEPEGAGPGVRGCVRAPRGRAPASDWRPLQPRRELPDNGGLQSS